jgi:hypothetical protein
MDKLVVHHLKILWENFGFFDANQLVLDVVAGCKAFALFAVICEDVVSFIDAW